MYQSLEDVPPEIRARIEELKARSDDVQETTRIEVESFQIGDKEPW